MALYVKKHGESERQVYHMTSSIYIDISNVESVQADCEELNKACLILDRKASMRVMTFFGDNAKEIVANW